MHRFLAPLLALLTLTTSLGATWSICVVDLRTGEVAVATATCLEDDDLTRFVPMLLVGRGAGAEQSAVDPTGVNRVLMRDLVAAGTPPLEVLQALLDDGTSPGNKQYGVASFDGFPATYSGVSAGPALGNVAGIVGDLSYAIQGNVLTGPEVCLAAEEALVGTAGDLAQKMMAAMEAARALGGDGRCSCPGSDPTGCGAPPASFSKSAHVGLLYVARPGDTDGACGPATGCAAGDYYLKLDIIDDASGDDPVLQLRAAFDVWRAALAGRPDALLSEVQASAAAVPADGRTTVSWTLDLRDVEGVPLTGGGASVSVVLAADSTADPLLTGVTDRGDGTYRVDVLAGTAVGEATLEITVDDGVRPVRLLPDPQLRQDPPAALHAGFDAVDVGSDVAVPFVLSEPAAAGGQHLLLFSLSGTVPGTPVGGLVVPLNRDQAFDWALQNAGGPLLPGGFGSPDGSGYASAQLLVPAELALPLAGLRLDAAALWFAAGQLGVTPPVGVDLTLGA